MSKLILSVVVVLAGCGARQPSETSDGSDPAADAAPFTRGMSTLAGTEEAGFLDGGRNVARFSNPVGVAFGADGRVYVADFDNNKVRAVDPAGNVSTIVAQPGFVRPFGMAFAPDGALFVSTDNDQTGAHDAMSGSVWRVDIVAGTATIVANAIGRPRSLAMLGDGRIAVADNLHHVVRLLDVRTGAITDLAGTWDASGDIDGSAAGARFSTPYGIAARADGSLVVADRGNHRLRVIGLDGSVTTLAGGSAGHVDGALSDARFDQPQAVAIAENGDVFVTDGNNFRIRKLGIDGVTTLAGDGVGGYLDADDPLAAQVYGLEGLALSLDGATLYIADGNRGEPLPFNRVRMLAMTR